MIPLLLLKRSPTNLASADDPCLYQLLLQLLPNDNFPKFHLRLLADVLLQRLAFAFLFTYLILL